MNETFAKPNYEKYKIKVKKWEKDFIKRYKRIPSKYDIKEAPNEIRYSYKMYYNLKTAFLENTFNDILSDDGFDVFETEMENSKDDLESSKYDFSNIFLPSGENLINKSQETAFSNNNQSISGDQICIEKQILQMGGVESHNNKSWTNTKSENVASHLECHIFTEKQNFDSISEIDINKDAWNIVQRSKSLNAIQKPVMKEIQSFRTKSSLNTKLFESSKSFSKRNPRKSLCRLSSLNATNTSSLTSNNKLSSSETLPDLESILTQKAKEQRSPLQKSTTISKDVLITIDNDWLERCAKESRNDIKDSDIILFPCSNLKTSEKTKFGLSNIKIQTRNFDNSFEDSQNTNNKITVEQNFIEENRKYDKDSDEVISNSEAENSETESCRYIVKRRRILRDIDRNKLNNTSNYPKEYKQIPEKLFLKPVVASDVDKIENRILEEKKEISEASKSSIKKKKVNEEKIFIVTEKKKKCITKVKTEKALKKLKTKKTKTKSLKSDQESESILEEDNEDEYQPFNLVLDDAKIKSLPSANFEELKSVDVVFKSYLNNTNCIKNEKVRFETDKSFIKSEAQAKLEEKIRTGKLNENFVRIDIAKKVFVRGKKSVNYSRYKKKMWKNKKANNAISGSNMDMRGCDGGILTCHKCNLPGHFANQCKQKGDSLMPLNVTENEESPFISLEEAAKMAQNKALSVHSRNISKLPEANNFELFKEIDDADVNLNKKNESINEVNESILKIDSDSKVCYIGHKIPSDFLEKCGVFENTLIEKEVKPIYTVKNDGCPIEVTDDVVEALKMFGHKNFRKGQEKAIMRILSGLSTLVTLSTGSGKSLCYQLPAYIYSRQQGCITLVISPLVSLMEDQVHDIPSFLRAYCLHTNQTAQQRLKVMELVHKGEIDILLVSPEAVVAGERSTGFGALLGKLPPIAFACIDEAHCVSQWSHNFRPSYLMICKVLKKKLGVKTILGLTATATIPTRQSIIRHLDIRDGEDGIISDTPLPDNLILSVSTETNRDNALVQILRSERFEQCQSIIIYCTRRDECERIAGFIRTCMQDKPSKQSTTKRKRVNWHAEPYHAGLPASRRRTIQNAFMKNELRIVVATIAFGMGINKPDIRAVIHYNMPKSYESYVQEIGRAGRDGKLAQCHLFLDSRGQDRSELKRHIFGNSIDRHVIRKLLQKIFISCSCKQNLESEDFIETHNMEIVASQLLNWNEDFETINDTSKTLKMEASKKRICPGHEIGFSVEETVQNLDIPEENICTLLCYLELDGRYDLNILSNAYTKCKVLSYGGPKYLKEASKNCSPLAMAIALQLKNCTYDEQKNFIEFSVIEIASIIGWNSGVVKHQLKNLEWIKVNDLPKRSPISVTFYDLGFRVKAPGDFSGEEIDEALDSLYQRSVIQEKTQLIQLQCISEGLNSVSFKNFLPCCDKDFDLEPSNKLKNIIRNYFQENDSLKVELRENAENVPDAEIINDIQSMIRIYPDNNFTGRSIARIFYGIGSPNFTPFIWSKSKYWRLHMKVDFNRLVKLANEVIVRLRM